MASSSASLLITVLSMIALFLPLTAATFVDPVVYTCQAYTDPEEFRPYDDYAFNQQRVMGKLYHSVAHTDSRYATAAIGTDKDIAYGVAQCRRDVSAADCQSCILSAATALQYLCGFNRTTFAYYDKCFAKFSGHNFVGQLDLHNNFTLVNTYRLTNATGFMNQTIGFLEKLSRSATAPGGKLYADGQLRLCDFLTLYGVVQCSRDVSRSTCAKCLGEAVRGIPGGNRQGARKIFGTCNARYEIYPIVGTPADTKDDETN